MLLFIQIIFSYNYINETSISENSSCHFEVILTEIQPQNWKHRFPFHDRFHLYDTKWISINVCGEIQNVRNVSSYEKIPMFHFRGQIMKIITYYLNYPDGRRCQFPLNFRVKSLDLYAKGIFCFPLMFWQ